jgi:hypothetical protein
LLSFARFITGNRKSMLSISAEETPTSNTKNRDVLDSLTEFDYAIIADVDSDSAVNTLFMQL